MSNTVILYAPQFVRKLTEIEYEEEVDVGIFFQRIVKQKKQKTDYVPVKNPNGLNLIQMNVLLPDGKYMTYSNTTERSLKQLMIAVLNIYQSQGYKAPQIEIVKFLNQKINQLILIR